jgi:hypothetical protein
MPRNSRFPRLVACLVLFAAAVATAQTRPATPPAAQAEPTGEYSGMYSFLQDGEFVQVDFLPDGKISGFVSRYGDLESDKGAFLDHFIKTGAWKGKQLSFETAPVHGVWFAFKGMVERGPAKTRNDEGYYVLRGTLSQYSTDAARKTSGRSREVTFKQFPQDEEPAAKKPQ